MKIEQYLKDNNTTLSGLAKKLNISVSYLSKIKNNQIRPSEETKKQLLKLEINELPQSNEEIKSHKNERIKQLLQENKALKQKILLLEKHIIDNIDVALDRAIHQSKTSYKPRKTKYKNAKN